MDSNFKVFPLVPIHVHSYSEMGIKRDAASALDSTSAYKSSSWHIWDCTSTFATTFVLTGTRGHNPIDSHIASGYYMPFN